MTGFPFLPVANGIVTDHYGRTRNLHGHAGSRFVYAFGKRVYGTAQRSWSHDRQEYVITGFRPEGKWAFTLGPEISERALERA